MKKSILLLTLAGTIAYGADQSYFDEINKRNNEIISHQKLGESEDFIQSKIADFFEPLIGVPINTLTSKRRSLSDSEKSQVGVLKCVDKLVKKHEGGYDAPSIAQGILMTILNEDGSLSTDLEKLDKASELCKHHRTNLVGYSNRKIDQEKYNSKISELSASTKTEIVSKELVAVSKNTSARCNERIVDAKVAVLVLGVNTGASMVTCLGADGAVTKFIGPRIGWSVGLAARISVGDLAHNTIQGTNKVMSATYNESYEEEVLLVFDGARTRVNGDENGLEKGVSLGMDQTWNNNLGMQFRFFNGMRRWDLLLDAAALLVKRIN